MLEILFFIFSFVMCWCGCVFYPKVNGKINAIICVMLGYVTTLCLGAGVALGWKLLHFPIDLSSMACAYWLMAVPLWGVVAYRRKIQKLAINKWDMWGILVGIILVGGIALYIFTPYLHINYYNTVDPSSHYYMALQVIKRKNVDIMYFSQLHNAMFMDIVMHFIPDKWNYKAFILADCFQTLMEYYFFYAFMLYVMRKKEKKHLPILITVLYWLGYPLYSWVRGSYVYWAMGATLVQYVFFILKIYEEKKELRKKCLVLLGIGCFSVTICYIEFTPGIMLSVFLVILLNIKNIWDINIIKKYSKWLMAVLVVCIMIAGIGYYTIFYARGVKIFDEFKIGSNTSKNLELVVCIPIIYYLIYKRARERKWNAYVYCLFAFLIVQFGFTILATLGMVSSYYLFKPNYILWSLAFIIIVDGYALLEKKEKRYIGHYLLIITLYCMFFYTPVWEEMETDDILDLNNSIWRYNAYVFLVNDFNDTFAERNRDLIDYIADHYQDETVTFISTNEQVGARAWYAGITGQEAHFVQSPFDEYWFGKYLEETSADYAVIFYESEIYRENAEFFEPFEKVYDSEEGFIFKVHSNE